jgi:Icc-related predicted phosphoesterase
MAPRQKVVMRLLVLSDLHLETKAAWTLPQSVPDFDVAVFAGDISSPLHRSISTIAAWPIMSGKRAIIVPGNHEFYDGVVEEEIVTGYELAKRHPSIHLLAPGVTKIQGVRFIGATLWTDYALYRSRRPAMRWARGMMPDHASIRVIDEETKEDREFTPADALLAHTKDLAFLEGALRQPHAGPTVVVTHHMPSGKSVAPWFQGNPLSPAFASDLEDFIDRHRPALWVHGHGHFGCDYRLGGTRVVANPKGYGPFPNTPKIENPHFDPGMIVHLG